MSKTQIAIAMVVLLAGCSSINYDPTEDIRDVQNQEVVNNDVRDCAKYASQMPKRPFDLGASEAATGEGAASNFGSIAVPGVGLLGVVFGGLGGFLNNTAEWLGINSIRKPRAEQQCVRQRLDRDHAGILVEAPL